MNLKKIVVYGLVILPVVVGLYLTYRSLTQTKEIAPQPTPTPLAVPQPEFPKEQIEQREYVLPDGTPSLPKNLPAYQAQPENTEVLSRSVAGWFGIGGQASQIQTSRGVLYSWNTDGGSLLLGGNPVNISFSSESVGQEVLNLTDQQYIEAAANFLQSNGFVPQSAELSDPLLSYETTQGTSFITTPRQRATIVRVVYKLTLSGFPVLSGNPDGPFASLRFNSSGGLVSFSGYYYGDILTTETEAPLAGIQEAYQRLRSGDNIITSEKSPQDTNGQGTPVYDFSTVSVSTISLGYYYSENQTILSPVYVFEGSARDQRTGKRVDTISLVSAVP